MEIVFGIILLVAAVFLVVAVLMQSGKAHNLSGTIAGGAETFFGKTKGKTIDKLLSRITTIVAICFVVLVIIVFVIQDDNDLAAIYDEYLKSLDTSAADTSAVVGADTQTAADTALADEGAEVTDAAGETTAAE